MDLAIIIVNWNSAHYVTACVSSIQAQTNNLEYEVIIVDNASTDDSCRILPECLPGVGLIRSPRNLGFARANNLGVESSTGRNLLFLNPDTELRGPAINLMHACLESSPGVGVLGCKLLNTDLTTQTSCVQSYPTILNQALDSESLKRFSPQSRLWGMRPLFEPQNGSVAEADMVSGACLMIPRQVFEKVGRFDPDYFIYAEDMDLCYRVKKAGWKICYLGSATIVHHGGQSSKKKGGEEFSGPMVKQSVFTFFQKTRGQLYASLYRAMMFKVALIRVCILGGLSLLPVGGSRQDSLRHSLRKWRKILRWTLGLEPWTQHLGESEGQPPSRGRA
jgi:hypothetical protein